MSKRSSYFLRTPDEIKKDNLNGYRIMEKFPNKNINPVFLPRTYVEKRRKEKEDNE